MKMILMSAALAGSVIWGSSAVQVNGIQSHSISEMAPLFDEEHAYETIHELSEVIGPRETGTEKEKEAASYISKRIQDEGLAVRIQPFHVKTYYSGSVMAGDHEYPIRSADKSAVENEERVEGEVLDGGYGLNLDEKEAKGKIAVLREGKISVSQKLKNAQAAGAKTVIIYNSKTKPLAIRPVKPKHITIPAAGMKKEDGEALLKEKQAVIQFKNYRNRTSQNIIGTRKAQHTKHPDILYVTAHYDTVKDAPGADDNASGTSAVLEMIEVPSFTFCSSVNVILHVGATPVFADICEDDLCIDPEDVRQKLSSRTKAVIAVHFAGYPANLNELSSICKENGLYLIEDAAHALGTRYNEKMIGTPLKNFKAMT
ncbi:Lactocepin [Bacillus subtilis]|uniref:DegT/DnrJ/EryC1/StrS family aminotransferase n=1 Tax=Bacillus subtilis TaxID=1423 RepID=UPI0007FEA273|nr:DegT/DnrJ/EryC1/StrS family aminotransferase [Bacillus subtilis]OAZ69790.1 Lactocepin [Bacillus subtilis]